MRDPNSCKSLSPYVLRDARTYLNLIWRWTGVELRPSRVRPQGAKSGYRFDFFAVVVVGMFKVVLMYCVNHVQPIPSCEMMRPDCTVPSCMSCGWGWSLPFSGNGETLSQSIAGSGAFFASAALKGKGQCTGSGSSSLYVECSFRRPCHYLAILKRNTIAT